MLLLPPSLYQLLLSNVSIIVHFSDIAITITPSPELDKFRGRDSERVYQYMYAFLVNVYMYAFLLYIH